MPDTAAVIETDMGVSDGLERRPPVVTWYDAGDSYGLPERAAPHHFINYPVNSGSSRDLPREIRRLF